MRPLSSRPLNGEPLTSGQDPEYPLQSNDAAMSRRSEVMRLFLSVRVDPGDHGLGHPIAVVIH
jgi:hypothetical protein